MGDMGEALNAFKAESRVANKNRKSHNKHKALGVLKKKKIRYEEKNNGLHLIIEKCVDFWPTTGKYSFRKRKIKGTGLGSLICALERNNIIKRVI